jgi:hypothetical protein
MERLLRQLLRRNPRRLQVVHVGRRLQGSRRVQMAVVSPEKTPVRCPCHGRPTTTSSSGRLCAIWQKRALREVGFEYRAPQASYCLVRGGDTPQLLRRPRVSGSRARAPRPCTGQHADVCQRRRFIGRATCLGIGWTSPSRGILATTSPRLTAPSCETLQVAFGGRREPRWPQGGHRAKKAGAAFDGQPRKFTLVARGRNAG